MAPRARRGLRAAALLLACAAATAPVGRSACALASQPAALAPTRAAPASVVARSTLPTPTVVGTSVRGRPIDLYSFGSGSRRILIVGGMHGNEYGAGIADKFMAYLAEHPSAVASGTVVDVVPHVNPDGLAAHRRTNAHGVDLNRNFPSRNWTRRGAGGGASAGAHPDSEPETQALVNLLAQNHYGRVVALHSKGPLIDYDGKGGWTLAHRIARAAHLRVVRLAAIQVYHGSLGRYVPERYHVPVITWELGSRKLTYRVTVGLLAALR